MKKRLLSVMLCLCMLLAYTPAQTWAVSIVPNGYTAVYTLEDIYKTADRDTPVKMILMNDIDADNEDITEIIGGMWGTNHWVSKLTDGSVLDGGGHTIYNLNHKLVSQNFGTIRNINVSIYDTDDVEKHWEYGYWAIGYDCVAGICSSNEGAIENCNVRITMHGKLNLGTTICGIAGNNSGTIKNCIAMFDVECNTSEAFSFYGITEGGVAATSSSPSLVDHCLTLGTVKCESSAFSAPGMAGIANMYCYGDRESYNDSACALEQMYCKMSTASGQIWPGVMFAYADQSSIEQAQVTNCRVANDMQLKVIDHDTVVAQDGKVTSAEKITLDSRANILKDWNISKIPAARPAGSLKPTPAPDPTPTPTPTPTPAPTTDPVPNGINVEFKYYSTADHEMSHYFYYDNAYFYSYDDGIEYQPYLAMASLGLAMSAFTDNPVKYWNNKLDKNDKSRQAHLVELYKTLGFGNAQYFNYDIPLTDTSDKVAYSMASKQIKNSSGGTDTVIAVVLRGGGYGGEWGSNFNVNADKNQPDYLNHVGFASAAATVKASLNDYIKQLNSSGKISGDLKLWMTGYSRSSAVANILGHSVGEDGKIGGISMPRKNMYVYTFATPAGVSPRYKSNKDNNIFNIVAATDLVPRVAPAKWGYSRYGNTLVIPNRISSNVNNRYWQMLGNSGSSSPAIISLNQPAILSNLVDAITYVVPDSMNYTYHNIQALLVKYAGDGFGAKPSDSTEDQQVEMWKQLVKNMTTAISAIKNPIGGTIKLGAKATLNIAASNVEAIIDDVRRAHHPELYFAWLEEGYLKHASDFMKTEQTVIIPIEISGEPERNDGVTVGSAYGDMNIYLKDKSGNVLASYVGGVCKGSDGVEAELTDSGLVFDVQNGKDCTLSVVGKDDGCFSFSAYNYGENVLDSPSRIVDFTDFDLENGTSYTFTLPKDPDSDYEGFEGNGSTNNSGVSYLPDYDSADGDERPTSDEETDRPDTAHMNFIDVPLNAYYYNAVQWAVESGITSGTSATRFSPGNACTRAQVVTFLWRAAGCPEPTSNYNPFVDVPANAYYRDAVLWAAEEGITTGVSSNRFAPNATVTRGQTVAFLWRWDGKPDAEKRSGFRDVPANAYYSDAVSWAVEMDITKGTSSTAFSPGKTCTRAQIVTFLYRDMWGGDYDD